MCNEYRLTVDTATIAEGFEAAGVGIRSPEGLPNIAALESIRITDTAPIIRAAADGGGAGDLIQRRWSWPGPGGRPVYNFRAEGREFPTGRCLIVTGGFYEFTQPADRAKARKDKWLFTKTGEPWFCIAGLWRVTDDVGEAFTMLTVPPGPDIAPYHDRQVAVLDRDDWAAWLDPEVSAKTLLKSLPAGSLKVEQVG